MLFNNPFFTLFLPTPPHLFCLFLFFLNWILWNRSQFVASSCFALRQLYCSVTPFLVPGCHLICLWQKASHLHLGCRTYDLLSEFQLYKYSHIQQSSRSEKSQISWIYLLCDRRKKGTSTVRICWEGKCSGKTSPTPFSMDQHLSFDKKNSVIPRAELHTST